jgi:hypothetical protein
MRAFPGKSLRVFCHPVLPRLPGGEMRLHSGCGKIDHPGFVMMSTTGHAAPSW